jgi:cytochrome P450
MNSAIADPIDPTSFNPNSAEYLDDPYPTYAWFRDHLPVAPLSLFPGKLPPSQWIFRYDDINSLLHDTDVFVKSATGPGAPPAKTPPAVFGALGALPPGLLSSDPPRHAEVRAAVEPSFLAQIPDVEAFATATAEAIVAQVSHSRRFELIGDVAIAVPETVLLHVLGLPAGDAQVLGSWAQTVVTGHNIAQPPSLLALAGTCAMALRTYYAGMIVENSVAPRGGMFEGVCEHIGTGLEPADVGAIMSDMLIAGFMTTTFLISTGLQHLLDHPEQIAALAADPTLWAGAVDEMLRIDAPAQMLDRQVAHPVTLGGVELVPGTRVVPVVGSANRDPRAYDDPDRFDIHRTERTQLGFGAGIHHCIGAPLARIVVPATLQALLSLEDLRIDGRVGWQSDPYLRGMTSLPLAWGA